MTPLDHDECWECGAKVRWDDADYCTCADGCGWRISFKEIRRLHVEEVREDRAMWWGGTRGPHNRQSCVNYWHRLRQRAQHAQQGLYTSDTAVSYYTLDSADALRRIYEAHPPGRMTQASTGTDDPGRSRGVVGFFRRRP